MLTVASSSLLTVHPCIVVRMATLGNRIKQRREQLALSQADLARALGITRSSISQIESGLTKGLKPHHLLQAATTLKTTVESLVHGVEQSSPARQEVLERPAASERREQALLRHWRALTKPQQREYFQQIRTQADANRVLEKIEGKPLKTVPNKRIRRAYGAVPPHSVTLKPLRLRQPPPRGDEIDPPPLAGESPDQ